jgi:hypothetical protein
MLMLTKSSRRALRGLSMPDMP